MTAAPPFPGPVTRGLALINQILRCNSQCYEFSDNTTDGFWGSFRAAWLALPVYMVQFVQSYGQDPLSKGAGEFTWITFQLVVYALGWLAYPVIMEFVTRMVGCRAYWCRYFVAFNWFQLALALALLPIIILASLLSLPPHVMSLPIVMLGFAMIGYHWFIARTMLELDGLTAAGIVILELFVSLLVNGGTRLLV